MINVSMDSFSDEMIKIALIPAGASRIGKVMEFIKRYKKPLGIAGLIGTGVVGSKVVGQAGKDYMLGRRVRKQYEERGG